MGVGIRRMAAAVYRGRRLAAIAAIVAVAGAGVRVVADPRVKSVGENDATGDVFKIYAAFKQTLGFVPNEYEAMSQDLGLLRVHAGFTHSLIDSTRNLTPEQKAMIGVVVGTALGNEYVKQLESWQLGRLGLKEDQVRRIQQDYQSAGLKSGDVAVLKFAQKISTSPGDLAEQDFSDLRWEGWTDRAILEISMVAGYYGYLARLAQVLGVDPDTYPEPAH